MPIGAAETEQPVPCKTAGYLINKTKDLLRLAVNRHIDGSQVGIVFIIPTPWITKVRVLK